MPQIWSREEEEAWRLQRFAEAFQVPEETQPDELAEPARIAYAKLFRRVATLGRINLEVGGDFYALKDRIVDACWQYDIEARERRRLDELRSAHERPGKSLYIRHADARKALEEVRAATSSQITAIERLKAVTAAEVPLNRGDCLKGQRMALHPVDVWKELETKAYLQRVSIPRLLQDARAFQRAIDALIAAWPENFPSLGGRPSEALSALWRRLAGIYEDAGCSVRNGYFRAFVKAIIAGLRDRPSVDFERQLSRFIQQYEPAKRNTPISPMGRAVRHHWVRMSIHRLRRGSPMKEGPEA
jgi:hypothetical protein